MAFDDFLNLMNQYPDALSSEILLKVSTFIHYAPRFKNDILLVQESSWPINVAPLFLPESVAILLANLCDISRESLESIWSYMRETVWSLSEKKREVDERFRLYAKDLGYGKF
jgi:hypothetical protein